MDIARDQILKTLECLNATTYLSSEEKSMDYNHLFDINMKVVLKIQNFVSEVISDYVVYDEDKNIEKCG